MYEKLTRGHSIFVHRYSLEEKAKSLYKRYLLLVKEKRILNFFYYFSKNK